MIQGLATMRTKMRDFTIVKSVKADIKLISMSRAHANVVIA